MEVFWHLIQTSYSINLELPLCCYFRRNHTQAMIPTKTMQISVLRLDYQGDNLGNSFFLHLILYDQFHFARSIHFEIQHGASLDLKPHQLFLEAPLHEGQLFAQMPVAIAVLSHDPENAAQHVHFGQNTSNLFIDLSGQHSFPIIRKTSVKTEVRGDYWYTKGQAKHKVAQFIFHLEFQCHWEMARFRQPGGWVLDEFLKGKRNFEGAPLQHAAFTGAKLAGIILSEANLMWANLNEAKLSGSTCIRTIFRSSDAVNANLESANLEGANLVEANFSDANLNHANLEAATINTRFDEATLRYTSFANARIHQTSFQKADLTGCSFRNAILTQVDFRNAVLKAADFTGAKIEFIDYSGADITDVINLNAPSIAHAADLELDQKSESYQKGFMAGYQRGYEYGLIYPEPDMKAWKKSIRISFPYAVPAFQEGYRDGFLERYLKKIDQQES